MKTNGKQTTKSKGSMPADNDGYIDANRVYTVNGFCRAIGIVRNGSAFNRLRSAGLPVRMSRYILGRDFLELLGNTTNDTGREEVNQDRGC